MQIVNQLPQPSQMPQSGAGTAGGQPQGTGDGFESLLQGYQQVAKQEGVNQKPQGENTPDTTTQSLAAGLLFQLNPQVLQMLHPQLNQRVEEGNLGLDLAIQPQGVTESVAQVPAQEPQSQEVAMPQVEEDTAVPVAQPQGGTAPVEVPQEMAVEVATPVEVPQEVVAQVEQVQTQVVQPQQVATQMEQPQTVQPQGEHIQPEGETQVTTQPQGQTHTQDGGESQSNLEGENQPQVVVRTHSQKETPAETLFQGVEYMPVKVGEATQVEEPAPMEATVDTTQPDMEVELTRIVEKATQDGAKTVELTLTPEHLGKVTVELTQHTDGRLEVVLQAHTDEAAALLKEGADTLRTLLQSSHGAQVEVQVPQSQQSEGASQQQNQDFQEGGQHQQHQQQSRHQQEEATEEFLQQLRLGLSSFTLE